MTKEQEMDYVGLIGAFVHGKFHSFDALSFVDFSQEFVK